LVNLCRWLNCEDPLINHNPWTAKEDKNLLLLVQEKGINNWFDIAASLGTNRTPFQCLARYQRSLNASMLKSEWTKDEDAQLRAAVEVFGEKDWQSVASALERRTGNQCSNRLVSHLEKVLFILYFSYRRK
jgi:myb proto-oncogene protein